MAFPGHGRLAETEAEAEIRKLKRALAIACQERDILEKAAACFANAKNFEFVRDHRESFEVGLMCKTLRVSRSGF